MNSFENVCAFELEQIHYLTGNGGVSSVFQRSTSPFKLHQINLTAMQGIYQLKLLAFPHCNCWHFQFYLMFASALWSDMNIYMYIAHIYLYTYIYTYVCSCGNGVFAICAAYQLVEMCNGYLAANSCGYDAGAWFAISQIVFVMIPG